MSAALGKLDNGCHDLMVGECIFTHVIGSFRVKTEGNTYNNKRRKRKRLEWIGMKLC